MNEIIHLYKLQTIDQQLDKIERRLIEINTLLGANEELQQSQLAKSLAVTQASEKKACLRKIEDEAEKLRIKIETDESSLYGGRIHNPKELQDLQSEIASLKKHQAHLEEQMLEYMLLLEAAEAELKAAEELLSQAQARTIERNASLQGELSQFLKQKERLLTERSAAANFISPEQLDLYTMLRKQKRGTAVSLIVDGGCSSCGATLTPAERQAARSPIQALHCSSCGRILYAG